MQNCYSFGVWVKCVPFMFPTPPLFVPCRCMPPQPILLHQHLAHGEICRCLPPSLQLSLEQLHLRWWANMVLSPHPHHLQGFQGLHGQCSAWLTLLILARSLRKEVGYAWESSWSAERMPVRWVPKSRMHKNTCARLPADAQEMPQEYIFICLLSGRCHAEGTKRERNPISFAF